MMNVVGGGANLRAATDGSRAAEDRHVDLQVLDRLRGVAVFQFRRIEANGVERHAGVVLVPLVDLLQVLKALLAVISDRTRTRARRPCRPAFRA